MTRHATFIACLATATVLLAADAPPPAFRLDGSVVPLRYRLDLTVDPASDRFSGTMEIDVRIIKASPLIWLHGSGIDVSEAVVRSSTGSELPAKAIAPGKDFIGLQMEKPVPSGEATLRIRYSAAFARQGNEGLFTREDSGHWYAYTQFEPLHARKAFPCFDEPAYKAPWRITLRVPADLKAFSNGPIESERKDGERKIAVFRETQPISTYLVAFAVGPFDVVDVGTAGRKRTPLRIIVPKGKGERTEFARRLTPKVFNALEEYFGMPYPFDKLDQIAFTFDGGGMENVGLITYGQQHLIAPPTADSPGRQRQAATVIAHEISHHWFGNSTTMQWWDDLWLKESFATWLELRVIDQLHPELNMLAIRQGMKTWVITQDSLVSARHIRQPIASPADIGQAFDSITYLKGAAVITMFENFIGGGTFRKGVQDYLRKHAGKNTTTADFLSALSSAAGKDMTAPFSTFLGRAGVPLVSVGLNCGKGRPQITIRQERLLPLGSSGDRKTHWQVPVCLRYDAGSREATQCILVSKARESFDLTEGKSCPAWINANPAGAGYYGVIYEGDLGEKLLAAPKLSRSDRANLLSETQMLFTAGLIGPEKALTIAERFASAGYDEMRNISGIAFYAGVLVPKDRQQDFMRMITRIFEGHVRRLGWRPAPQEDSDTSLLRRSALLAVLELGNAEDLDTEARKLTKAWLSDPSTLHPATADAIVKGAARKADRELFDALWKAAEDWTDVQYRGQARRALGNVGAPELVKEALGMILTTKHPANERVEMVYAIGKDPRTASVLWDFVKQHYTELTERLPSHDGVDPGAFLIGALSGLCTVGERDELRTFFNERVKSISGGPRDLAQTLEEIDLCVARKAAHEREMEHYLSRTRRAAGTGLQ